MKNYILCKIIGYIKKEDFQIDPNIPPARVIGLIISKGISLFSGCWKLRRIGKYSIGFSTVIKSPYKIQTSGGIIIDKKCHIDALSSEGIQFGRNVSIGKYTTIECTGSLRHLGKGLTVGNNVGMGTHGFFGCAGGIKIGDDTIFGNYVSLHAENHNYSDATLPIRLQGVNHKGISIGKNCWIGAKTTILDGTKLGDGCIVAAGAVVRGEFPDNVIIGGVPAKIIKNRFDE